MPSSSETAGPLVAPTDGDATGTPERCGAAC
jgi:hypothetical protein